MDTKKFALAFALLVIGNLISLQHSPAKDKAEIHKIMQTQEDAWNRADLDAFMEGYWKSDELTFVGKNGLTKGWRTTLDNYKRSYPNPESMGKLKFTILGTDKTSKKSAFVIGKWQLTRSKEKGDLGGHFSLLWKKIKGHWVIVADHSS